MTGDQDPAPLGKLLHMFGSPDGFLAIEESGRVRHPDAGLPVGFVVDGDQQSVAVAVVVQPGTDLHRKIREIAADERGGRLLIELSPAAARRTAGSLAVRADEVDPDAAGPLAVLADSALEGVLRGLVFSALPDSMPWQQVSRTADLIAGLVAALARATVARG